MAIRSQFITKENFTGRKRIKQKPELIQVKLLGRTSDSATIELRWDEDKILQDCDIDPSKEHVLVFDVMFLGSTQRFELLRGDSERENLYQFRMA